MASDDRNPTAVRSQGTNPDPRGLIAEALRMDGLNPPECRSIFLDWMLGLSEGADVQAKVRALLREHADDIEGHPMKDVLEAALAGPITPVRRGGRRGRKG